MDPNPATQRIFFDGWQGTPGLEENENLVLGFAETIEYPYGGISGWARVCFAIIASEAESQVPEWIHGYEALLLPGGRIMLGRWMDLEDSSGRGPFIFWDI